MTKFRKLSEQEPPSRQGKSINFWSLREQQQQLKKPIPSKNKNSESFAVSEDKV